MEGMFTGGDPYPILCSFDFMDYKVYEIMTGLDTSKAMGIDGLGPNLLKHCASAICKPLCQPFLNKPELSPDSN